MNSGNSSCFTETVSVKLDVMFMEFHEKNAIKVFITCPKYILLYLPRYKQMKQFANWTIPCNWVPIVQGALLHWGVCVCQEPKSILSVGRLQLKISLQVLSAALFK